MADIIQLRRDTAANWTSANPTLAQGELGIEIDTSKIKVGDGSTVWSGLSYLIDTGSYISADGNGNVDISGELIADSYNESFDIITSANNSAIIDCEAGNVFSHTLSEDVTYTFSNAPSANTAYGFTLKVVQDSTARAITWPASVDWPSAVAPTLSPGSGDVDVFVFFTIDGGTTFYGFTAGQVMS